MQLYLGKPFDDLWRAGDPFERASALQGQVRRAMNGRRTLRFSANGSHYYAKVYQGVGWREIVKNLAQLKWPVLSARNEWTALNLLRRIGVETLNPVAFGLRGRNPAHLESFLITAELTETCSLEDFCRDWLRNPPPAWLKRALIERLAGMVRRMHRSGMNHRDCYLCHFHLHVPEGPEGLRGEDLHLFMIDLHRAQLRRRTPQRWLIKDLAGLYFSALDIGLTAADCCRFLAAYEQEPLREILPRHAGFWRRVVRTADALYRKEFGKAPSKIHGIP